MIAVGIALTVWALVTLFLVNKYLDQRQQTIDIENTINIDTVDQSESLQNQINNLMSELREFKLTTMIKR